MKKIAAILLIALFVFNLAGYRWVFNYMQQQADVQLAVTLDNNNYNEADLITLSVPTNLPYQTDRPNFERVDGEINYQGKVYKYVKRKIVDGQLVLLCLPDHNKMRLQSARDDFFKNANDLLQNNQSKKSDHSKNTGVKFSVSDYIAADAATLLLVGMLINTSHTTLNCQHLPNLSIKIPWQPPRVA